MTTFYLVDYKGKHFIIEDNPDGTLAFPMSTITKEKALEPDFVATHKERCKYYGIPAVITKDKDLLKAYGQEC